MYIKVYKRLEGFSQASFLAIISGWYHILEKKNGLAMKNFMKIIIDKPITLGASHLLLLQTWGTLADFVNYHLVTIS